jgi:hypothetical protein
MTRSENKNSPQNFTCYEAVRLIVVVVVLINHMLLVDATIISQAGAPVIVSRK